MDRCCSLYNLTLAERKDVWKNDKKSIKYVDQQNKLSEFKKKNPEYKIVYSKTLQGVLKKLDANYKSFFGLRKNGDVTARPPNFRSRNFFQTIVYNQSGSKSLMEEIVFPIMLVMYLLILKLIKYYLTSNKWKSIMMNLSMQKEILTYL